MGWVRSPPREGARPIVVWWGAEVSRVCCVGMNMWARPGASNGASTHRSAQASRTSTHIHTPLSIQSVFLAPTPSSIRFHTSSMWASGGGAVHPLKEPVRLRSLLSVIRNGPMLVCGSCTASCRGFPTHACVQTNTLAYTHPRCLTSARS